MSVNRNDDRRDGQRRDHPDELSRINYLFGGPMRPENVLFDFRERSDTTEHPDNLFPEDFGMPTIKDEVLAKLITEAESHWKENQSTLNPYDLFTTTIDDAVKIIKRTFFDSIPPEGIPVVSSIMQRAATALSQHYRNSLIDSKSEVLQSIPGSDLGKWERLPWIAIDVQIAGTDHIRPWVYRVDRADLQAWLEVLQRNPAQFWSGAPHPDAIVEKNGINSGSMLPVRIGEDAGKDTGTWGPLNTWAIDYEPDPLLREHIEVSWPDLAIMALTVFEFYECYRDKFNAV